MLARPFGVSIDPRPPTRVGFLVATAGDAGGVHMVVSSHGKATAVCRQLLLGMFGVSHNIQDLAHPVCKACFA